MILLLDWDGTLWNSIIFQHQFKDELCKKYEVTHQKFQEAIASYRASLINSTDFNPKSFCKFLSLFLKIPEKDLIYIFLENEDLYKKALYEDTEKFLISLSKKNNLRIGVFSEGTPSFQENKLKMTGMYKYFEPSLIYIFRKKMLNEALDKIPRDALIIDNKDYIVKELKLKGFKAKMIDRPKQTLSSVFSRF